MKNINKALKEITDTTDIIAPHYAFWCCQSCGSTELWEMINDHENHGGKNGYIFYHEQDKDDHYKNGRGYLAFGHYTEDDDETVKMIKKVLPIFEKHNIKIEWNEQADTRLLAIDLTK